MTLNLYEQERVAWELQRAADLLESGVKAATSPEVLNQVARRLRRLSNRLRLPDRCHVCGHEGAPLPDERQALVREQTGLRGEIWGCQSTHFWSPKERAKRG